MWVLEEELLGTPEVSSTDSVPLVFAARIYGDLSSWHWNSGLGLLIPKISLPNFYPLHMGMGPGCSTSPHLLPIWMDVVFFSSIVVGFSFNLISDGSA